ncbi:DNA translocase FtsK 4TM domain-containing protein [Reichenbachiella sp. MALMAid0571]|uniref:FtsK/SpoIIIE family DNA translocase n=1 Tax=Reichenbachiella sp. MALMAid0571 TaxID=3143939 RepID=UPI0032DF197A
MSKNTYKSKPKEKEKSGFKLPSVNVSFLHDRRLHLSLGFLLLVSSLFLLTAFISYLFTGQSDQSLIGVADEGVVTIGQETDNWLGSMGAIASHYFMFKYFGIASYLIPPLLFLVGFKIVFQKEILSIQRSFVFVAFFLVWISMFLGYIMFSSDQVNSWGFLVGGAGYELALFFDSLFGWGTVMVLILSLLVFIIYFFNVTSLMGLENISFLNPEKSKPAEEGNQSEEELSESAKLAAVVEAIKEEVEQEEQGGFEGLEDEDEEPSVEEWEVKEVKPKKVEKPELVLDVEIKDSEEEEEDELPFEVADTSSKEERTDVLENYDPTLDLASYKYPTVDLLTDYPEKNVQVSKEELEQNKDKIVETLINFKIGISSIKATIGPTVTLYEIVPDAGVKISKIKNLEDDIALSLAALGIRIIAPIPGKGTIGIEVPNKNREMVDVKSVLMTDKFMKSNMELPIVLGKTISNEVFVTDLAKMPHLLMAGATGQGKSVGLNILLTSLIYKKHPSQLKLVLVDPKKVELTLFNKIERHFLAKLPDSEEAIITDTKKVIYTLNSLCIEMDNRYDLLKDAGCRNLKEYNKKFVQRKLNPNSGHKFLPYIVLVIDELADLMMTAGKEIETPIARLAQLARAIGIHLVVATQRPSVNVITGIIKANFPARLSFRVTSKIDSRTILDAGGADQLVGMGDMLLSMGSEIIRLQCGFVDTPEVERICEFVGSQRGYETAYMLPEFVGEDGESSVGDIDLADRDVLFDDAARLIVLHQQGSTSLIQRKLKLGYNRAGRLIDQLEAAGIVGAFEGSKAREVLVKDEYSLEQLLNSL